MFTLHAFIWPRTPTQSSSSSPSTLFPYLTNSPFIHLLTKTLIPPMKTSELTMDNALDQQKFHSPHQLYLSTKKSLRDIDIPPRKLLNRRASAVESVDSPGVLSEEALFKKFLPYNSGVDSDEESDPYAADHFRIYEFKVRKCTRSRSHDWTDCPFAHPGEKARRRCPRRYNYSGTVCADFRRGSCSRGDLCEFAHGVFECWLHPSRYRTEACKDGKNCQRKICFFAHTQRQLRVVPAEPAPGGKKFGKDSSSSQCCGHCRCHMDVHHTISPTSTLNIDLDSLSPPLSPPFSPARSRYSPISRFADRLSNGDHSFCMTHLGNNSPMHRDSMNELINNQSLNELMRSMEAMAVEENELASMGSTWVDACFNGGGGSGGGGIGDQRFQVDHLMNQTPCGSDPGQVFVSTGDSSSVNGPDLGWVNDLLT